MAPLRPSANRAPHDDRRARIGEGSPAIVTPAPHRRDPFPFAGTEPSLVLRPRHVTEGPPPFRGKPRSPDSSPRPHLGAPRPLPRETPFPHSSPRPHLGGPRPLPRESPPQSPPGPTSEGPDRFRGKPRPRIPRRPFVGGPPPLPRETSFPRSPLRHSREGGVLFNSPCPVERGLRASGPGFQESAPLSNRARQCSAI